jgi:desulfoferrodoxin (superoxide reductase-like protein)
MRLRQIFYLLACALLLLAPATAPALANVPAVSIQAPGSATAGEAVPVAISVDHRGTGGGHYVDSVRLYDEDRLLKEWAYDRGNFERAQQWTVRYDGAFNRGAQLKAIAHCNFHGDGSGSAMIGVR